MKQEIIGENKDYLVKIIENPDWDNISDSWKRLQVNYPLYLTFEFSYPYVKNIGSIGTVILFTLERKDNKLVEAVFPFRKKRYVLYEKYFPLCSKPGFDYEPITSSINAETKRFFLQTILAEICTPSSLVSLEPITQEFSEELTKHIALTHLKMIRAQFQEHLFVLTLPRSREELLKSFDGKFRKNLEYYRRKLEKEFSSTFENTKNLRENRETYAEFLTLHRGLIETKGRMTPFEYKPFQNYIFDVVSGFGNNGGIFSMKLNGDTACMLLYIDWNDTRYFLNIGVSSDYRKYSVSSLLIIYAIEDAINHGMKHFNFGQGEEPYKEDWGCKRLYNDNVTIVSNKLIYLIDSSINSLNSAIKHVVRIPVFRTFKKVWMNTYLARKRYE